MTTNEPLQLETLAQHFLSALVENEPVIGFLGNGLRFLDTEGHSGEGLTLLQYALVLDLTSNDQCAILQLLRRFKAAQMPEQFQNITKLEKRGLAELCGWRDKTAHETIRRHINHKINRSITITMEQIHQLRESAELTFRLENYLLNSATNASEQLTICKSPERMSRIDLEVVVACDTINDGGAPEKNVRDAHSLLTGIAKGDAKHQNIPNLENSIWVGSRKVYYGFPPIMCTLSDLNAGVLLVLHWNSTIQKDWELELALFSGLTLTKRFSFNTINPLQCYRESAQGEKMESFVMTAISGGKRQPLLYALAAGTCPFCNHQWFLSLDEHWQHCPKVLECLFSYKGDEPRLIWYCPCGTIADADDVVDVARFDSHGRCQRPARPIKPTSDLLMQFPQYKVARYQCKGCNKIVFDRRSHIGNCKKAQKYLHFE